MTDDDQAIADDALAELLRRVGDDPTLMPQHRDRARAAMLAEFDASVVSTGRADPEQRMQELPTVEFDGTRLPPSSRSAGSWWSVAAAACLIALALAAAVNLRRDSSASDAIDPPLPTSPATLPEVGNAPELLTATSLPTPLGDAIYRTDEIGNGLSFGGADGLQLVALRPGLLVLDAVSSGGDLQGRVTVFEADQTAVAEVISAAVEDGYLQVSEAQFTGGGRSLRRQDVTVTGEGVAGLACVAQSGCLPLVDAVDEFDPSVWARSENFLVEASPGSPAVFVLVQTKAFGDPLLSQSFEIIDSFRLD